MISETVQTALRNQINHEFYSSYYYLAISTYFESVNLPGFAHWMRAQSHEEAQHAMKIFKYVYSRGGHVELDAIAKPVAEFGSPGEAFQAVLEHEQKVTKLVGEIYELSVREADYPTQIEMQWFIQEQVEEEQTATTIIEQLKMIGTSGSALIMLDRHLASR